MTDKKFNAILAKNQVARQIANYAITGEINISILEIHLQAIEDYLGVANQPSINDIIENNSNKEKYQI